MIKETGYTELERHLFGIFQTDPTALSTVTFYLFEDDELDTESKEEEKEIEQTNTKYTGMNFPKGELIYSPFKHPCKRIETRR